MKTRDRLAPSKRSRSGEGYSTAKTQWRWGLGGVKSLLRVLLNAGRMK